ncbi:MAG: GTPase HflX [Thermoanaerobaculales bacterium]|nr:GTPase HflX [Thermoanaerobaculales bacterium]
MIVISKHDTRMYEPHCDVREPTLIVGVTWAGMARTLVEDHLDELERLVDTAGGEVLERVVQERRSLDPATVVGSGFLARVAERCSDLEIRSLIFDEDLTGSQVRNIEQAVPKEVKVLDRAAVILDIFAQRARSREAQTQVELAQLNYLLPRLTRRWTHLSRQEGGIGTRGVGETQLEIDRRLISKRIAQLKSKLVVIERDRRLRRNRRSDTSTLALVGYTNAGKSSLFRRLSRADVLIEDRLFATLDPRIRRIDLGHEVAAVVVDTVGFVRKLPHHLVAPFRSTLEEAAEADIVLHVVDAAHPSWEEHLRVGQTILDELDVDQEKILVVLNKIDLLAPGSMPYLPLGRPSLRLSAASGEGLAQFRNEVRVRLMASPGVVVLRVPLEQPEMVQRAVALPHQIARRFRQEFLDLAVRADESLIRREGLGTFLAEGWV